MTSRTTTILLMSGLAAAAALAQSTARAPSAAEELICERSPKDHGSWPAGSEGLASSDLQKVAWVLRRSAARDTYYVVVNGEAIAPPADEFLEPVLSPDGQHILRAGRRGKSWSVWLDGEPLGDAFDEIRGIGFTPNGRALFAGRRKGAWTWFVGREEQPFPSPEIGAIAVSGTHLAYGAKTPDGWRVVLDGEPSGSAFDAIVQILFSPDGSRLACLGLRQGQMVAVIDGKEEPARPGILGLRFSPDSKRVAYVAIETSGEGALGRLVVDGRVGQPFPALVQSIEDELRTFLSSPRLARALPPEPKPYLTGLSAPVFASDGTLIYAAHVVAPAQKIRVQGGPEVVPSLAQTAGQEGVFVEGRDKPLHPATLLVAGPVLSDTGGRIAWVEWDAAASRWSGVVAGRPGESVASVTGRTNQVQQLTLARSGSRLAFVHLAAGSGFARGKGGHALWQVVATGLGVKPYEAGDVQNLRFSEDARHLAYEVHDARDIDEPGTRIGSFVVLDGVPGRAYADVLRGSMRFVASNAVRYIARVQEAKGGPFRYYRVTQTR
jgi:hypothetical protein